MNGHANASFSNNLTEDENQFLRHMQRWGSDGYPVSKLGRKWQFDSAFGVGGSPILYSTKKLAVGAVTAYVDILLDKVAGRLDPSPGSPAALAQGIGLMTNTRQRTDRLLGWQTRLEDGRPSRGFPGPALERQMAYMSQDRKQTLEPGIKKVLTQYGMKGTIGVRNHSTLVVTVTEGPLDLIGNANAKSQERCEPGERRVMHKDCVAVSRYYARDQFSGDCQAFALALLEACNVGNHDNSHLQPDHHDVGCWFVAIDIGRSDRPYTLLQAASAASATAVKDERVATNERDYGGVFDGFTVTSDADPGL